MSSIHLIFDTILPKKQQKQKQEFKSFNRSE